MPKYFEDFVREALAEKYSGEEEVVLFPEVDAVITVRGRAVCCADVKMRAEKKDMECWSRKLQIWIVISSLLMPITLDRCFADIFSNV